MLLGPCFAPIPGIMTTLFKSYLAGIWGRQEEIPSPPESFYLPVESLLAADALQGVGNAEACTLGAHFQKPVHHLSLALFVSGLGFVPSRLLTNEPSHSLLLWDQGISTSQTTSSR